MFWAELNEFNRHFKDSKVRMDGIGKRLKSLEECNGADDEKDEASRKNANARLMPLQRTFGYVRKL